jgi:hypothetical protein
MDFYDYCHNEKNFRDSRTYKDVVNGVAKREYEDTIPSIYAPSVYGCDSGYCGDEKCPVDFREYDGGEEKELYTGDMVLTENKQLLFVEDKCSFCNKLDCDLLNMRCGCAYHKWCIRVYLRNQINECPSCVPIPIRKQICNGGCDIIDYIKL